MPPPLSNVGGLYGALSVNGCKVRDYLRVAIHKITDKNTNLSTKFWVQFYVDFPTLVFGGCVSALPTPPTECLPVRDSIVDGLQKVMHPNFAMRSTERFALALETISALNPLNESELYGVVNASEESVNVSKLHSDRMKMHILELFGRISIIQLWNL